VNSKLATRVTLSKCLSYALSLFRANRRLIEATAAGSAYAALLCWLSTCAVASFRGAYLSRPYWAAIPALRTDTCGVFAFAVAAVSLPVSEYLRLLRRHSGEDFNKVARCPRKLELGALAVSETVAVLSTGLVAYISVNAVTHPVTLGIHATHFASWPTEGTLRVLALLGCVASVATLRYLRSGLSLAGFDGHPPSGPRAGEIFGHAEHGEEAPQAPLVHAGVQDQIVDLRSRGEGSVAQIARDSDLTGTAGREMGEAAEHDSGA
jgi:hypothetical protein